jgi:hypothetical protein
MLPVCLYVHPPLTTFKYLKPICMKLGVYVFMVPEAISAAHVITPSYQ